MTKSCTRTSWGAPFGCHSRPPFLKSPTSSFFRIAEVRPVPWNSLTQKTECRIGELSANCIAFVVRDISVHEAPQPLDRIEMRTIGRDEVQLDPAPGRASHSCTSLA